MGADSSSPPALTIESVLVSTSKLDKIHIFIPTMKRFNQYRKFVVFIYL